MLWGTLMGVCRVLCFCSSRSAPPAVPSPLHTQLPRAAHAFSPFCLSGEELINAFFLRQK